MELFGRCLPRMLPPAAATTPHVSTTGLYGWLAVATFPPVWRAAGVLQHLFQNCC